jgi:hypothetical protein
MCFVLIKCITVSQKVPGMMALQFNGRNTAALTFKIRKEAPAEGFFWNQSDFGPAFDLMPSMVKKHVPLRSIF